VTQINYSWAIGLRVILPGRLRRNSWLGLRQARSSPAGTVDFRGAKFSGARDILVATGATVNFAGAEFSGGTDAASNQPGLQVGVRGGACIAAGARGDRDQGVPGRERRGIIKNVRFDYPGPGTPDSLVRLERRAPIRVP
jgi:hypothetical protein